MSVKGGSTVVHQTRLFLTQFLKLKDGPSLIDCSTSTLTRHTNVCAHMHCNCTHTHTNTVHTHTHTHAHTHMHTHTYTHTRTHTHTHMHTHTHTQTHHRKLFCSHYFTWTFCTIYVAGSVASLWACQPYLESVTPFVHTTGYHNNMLLHHEQQQLLMSGVKPISSYNIFD